MLSKLLLAMRRIPDDMKNYVFKRKCLVIIGQKTEVELLCRVNPIIKLSLTYLLQFPAVHLCFSLTLLKKSTTLLCGLPTVAIASDCSY